MRPFRDARKTLLAFPCFPEGRVCVHTACVCLQVCVCVCVCECAMRVCGTLPGRTVSPGKGAEEEGRLEVDFWALGWGMSGWWCGALR